MGGIGDEYVGGFVNEILKRILSQNWAFYTHRQLFDMVRTEAAGAGALSDTDQAWTEFSALMADSRRRVDELLRAAGASWEGVASTSMRAGVTPLAQWADDAGTAGRASGGGLQQIGDAFDHAAKSMPEPVEIPPDAGFPSKYVHLFGGLTDQDKQTRLAHEAKRRAVELMQQYSTNAHTAVSSLGVFVPPQEVTVRSGPFTFSGGAVVQHGNGVITTGPVAGPESRAPGAGGTQDPKQDKASRARRAPLVNASAETPEHATTSVAGATPPAGTGRPEERVGGGLPGAAGVSEFSERSRSGNSDPKLSRPPGGPGAGLGTGAGGWGQAKGATERAGTRVTGRMGAGMVPVGAARREEEREHVSPEYLVTDHDEVWDGMTASPPVIGED